MANESSAAILEINTDNDAPLEKEIIDELTCRVHGLNMEYNEVSVSQVRKNYFCET